MAIWGKNGFIRKQEVSFARKLLIWKYNQSGTALPDGKALSAHAQKIVDDAHVIAKKSGSNVLEIMKDAVKDMKNRKK
jgi:ribosomal protein S7